MQNALVKQLFSNLILEGLNTFVMEKIKNPYLKTAVNVVAQSFVQNILQGSGPQKFAQDVGQNTTKLNCSQKDLTTFYEQLMNKV